LVPSEESILSDARVALAELARRETRAQQRLVFGHSMGGALAVALIADNAAAQNPTALGGLVLESTFASVRSLTRQARWYGFLVVPLVGRQFDPARHIGTLTLPLWMLHGAKDLTVPLAQGQTLAKLAPKGTPFYVFDDATHSDLHRVDRTRYQTIWTSIRESVANPATSSRVAPDPSNKTAH
jgi:uncharacterized protein